MLTVEEKRRIAIEIFAQEQARLQNRNASVLDAHSSRVQTTLARSERQHRMMTMIAQNGITWREAKKSTFGTAVEHGKNDMMQPQHGLFLHRHGDSE